MRITADAALQHPALTSTVPPPSRLDNILLPSPVIRFNFPPGTVLEPATTVQFENRFRSFGHVLKVRWEAGSTEAVYVQFLRLKEAMKARGSKLYYFLLLSLCPSVCMPLPLSLFYPASLCIKYAWYTAGRDLNSRKCLRGPHRTSSNLYC